MWHNILWTIVLIYIGYATSQGYEGDTCLDKRTQTFGRCKFIERCQSAQDDLQTRRVQPTLCSYAGTKQIVCCRDRNDEATKRISEKKCDEYAKAVTQDFAFIPLLLDAEPMTVSTAKCSYDNVKLIVGGETTDVGEFPHMAAIGWRKTNGEITIKCGGSLISERFVMTAGHCLKSRSDNSLASLEPAVVRLGDQNVNPSVDDGADPVEVTIQRIYKHPEYNSPKQYNDIGLLKLSSDVTLNSDIRPACLWTKPTFDGQTKALATGWGITESGSREPSEELQKVTLDIIESGRCDTLLKRIRNRLWNGMAPTQMCAGVLAGGKDTCQGDSGGPLQLSSSENQCIFHVLGVVSFGPKCGQANQPAVYTRVSEFLDWIEPIVWPNGA